MRNEVSLLFSNQIANKRLNPILPPPVAEPTPVSTVPARTSAFSAPRQHATPATAATTAPLPETGPIALAPASKDGKDRHADQKKRATPATAVDAALLRGIRLMAVPAPHARTATRDRHARRRREPARRPRTAVAAERPRAAPKQVAPARAIPGGTPRPAASRV